jgi:hypothetical protein|tara:strand:- start:800 stop:1102 length:303 start_codon:yes stop_codon:yes gene_type:complete
MELYESPEMYEKIVHYDEEKEVQIRLTVSTFRGIEYLHLRKYYLSFDEEWCPTPEGVAFPLDFNNSRELFAGLVEILSLAESKEIIEENFSDLIQDLYIK